METDKSYYQILLLFPNLIKELTNLELSSQYKFDAPVVKALEKRLDGLLLPESDDPTVPIVFVEAQMQPDPQLYQRILTQLATYTYQYNVSRPWVVVAIYPNRRTERPAPPHIVAALNLTTIYLDELEGRDSEGWECLRLIVAPVPEVPDRAASLVERVRVNPELATTRLEVIQTISGIVAQKFPEMSDVEIKRMLNLVPLEQTRSFKEGEEKKARDIARNLLQEGMGVETVARVTGLTIEEVRAISS